MAKKKTAKKKRSHKEVGNLSRSKGRAFEQWTARALRPYFPKARRHLENHKADARGFDLDFTEPFVIQCKNYAGYAPINKIEEAAEEAKLISGVPVLVTKGLNKKPVAVLYFEDFLELVKNTLLLEDPDLVDFLL